MYNREKTFSDFQIEKAVKTAILISAEGLLLCSELENGVEVVRPCAAAANEKIVGFSTATNLAVSTENVAKRYTIPTAAPYTVDTGFTNLVPGQILVHETGNTTPWTDAGGAPAATTQYDVNDTTGVITFHSSDAGKSVDVFLKYNLTVEQARLKYFEGFIGNDKAFAVHGRIGALGGKGVIYTDQFDITKDYSAQPALTTGANGLITVAGAGTIIPARVIEAPSISGHSQFFQNVGNTSMLGIEFNF